MKLKCITLLIFSTLMFTHSFGKMKSWTTPGGDLIEAEYLKTIGDKIILKTPAGKMIKIPVDKLIHEDQEYLELVNYPSFDLSFLRKSNQRFLETGPYIENVDATIFDFTFGARVEQSSAHTYHHELTIEYFAIGKETKPYGDKFILLDRKSSTFIPSTDNRRSHSFSGDEIELMQYVYGQDSRGREYYGYVITITDVRGEIIAHRESNGWLFEHLENIKERRLGAYMDKTGQKARPTRPKPQFY